MGAEITKIVNGDFNKLIATLVAPFADIKSIIIITDENVFALHKSKCIDFKTIVIKAGEEFKQQTTVDYIIKELIKFEADRKTFIVGIGGGVVTDITGYAASIYMRGLKFGFVPTTVLAMVDASIGGKNGIDVGLYKNLVGLIKQPQFLLYDYSMLSTLPYEHWVNGFAEIIKHACIKDYKMFELLENHLLNDFIQDNNLLKNLIDKNVAIKSTIVNNDEFEQGERKLLNFGHTIGHAIENTHQLLHGHAVSIGIIAACKLSEKLNDFDKSYTIRILNVLKKYQLNTFVKTDVMQVFDILKMDKKRFKNKINFILLNSIGEAKIKPVLLDDLQKYLKEIL